MKAAKKERRRRTSVSASELAQMGVCERLVVFEHRHGNRTTTAQRAAIRRGLRAHEEFYREGRAAQTTHGRCFIATTVFGDGPETEVLLGFRDRVLRRRPMGRWLIAAYYRHAPRICLALERRGCARSMLRMVLRPVVSAAAVWVKIAEARDAL